MTRRLTIAASIVAAAAIITALAIGRRARADEDEEQPIVSSAAQVSRDASGRVVIAISPAAQKEIGLKTETPAPAVRQPEAEAYGFVLDPAPLSKLNSDLIGADAALAASEAQFRRTKRLYAEQKNVALRDLQAAQAAYLAGKAQVQALDDELRDDWGGEIAKMDAASRAEFIGELIDRREAIARVTVPGGTMAGGLPATAEVRALGHENQPFAARAVYSAPAINPKLQGESFILLMSAVGFPLPPGMAISAALPSSAKSMRGVMVPRSAVVRYAGKQWVYQGLDANRFTRREIVPVQASAAGYFVTANLKPGMSIVVIGAQTLLSEELKGQIQPED